MIRPMAGWLLAAAMAGWLLAAAALATDDVGRAWQRVPGASYRGEDLPMAATILNRFLLDAYGHAAVPCDALDLGDLDTMRRELLAVRDDALDSIYRENFDKRALRTSDWAASRAEEMSLAAASTTAHNALRDAACHEVAMIFTHHLAAGARADVARAMTLPLLPTARRAPLAPGLLRDRVAAMTTCSGCHTTEVPDGTPPNPPDLAGSPRLLPEAWRAFSTVHAALSENVTNTHDNVYRYAADQALYVHHTDPECFVLLENYSTWGWIPAEKKCAKIFHGRGRRPSDFDDSSSPCFVGHGAPPRDWIKTTYYNYSGVVNITDDDGVAREAKEWCGAFEDGEVDDNICWWEDLETGLPRAHRFKVFHGLSKQNYDMEFYYNVTVEGADASPIVRPDYCPPEDAPPLYAEGYPNFQHLCSFE